MLDFDFVLLMPDGTLLSKNFAKAFGKEQAARLRQVKVTEITRLGDQISVEFAGKQRLSPDRRVTIVLDQHIEFKVTESGNTRHFTAFSGIGVKVPLLPQATLVEMWREDADADGYIQTEAKLKTPFRTLTARFKLDRNGKAHDLKIG